jgi:hypothetical protein
MAVISKGQTFATGDQVSALKLNNLADNATFASGAVDNVSTQLSGGAIVVKDGGVTTAKLNDGAVTTAKITDANVTTAKIADANVTFAKLTDVIDDDTMATATDTTLATSESIKAYIDTSKTSAFTPSTYAGEESITLPNGLIMKFGTITVGSNATATVTFSDAFPDSCIVVNATFNQNMGISGDQVHISAHTIGTSSFQLTNGTFSALVGWQAIGY